MFNICFQCGAMVLILDGNSEIDNSICLRYFLDRQQSQIKKRKRKLTSAIFVLSDDGSDLVTVRDTK